MPLDQPLPRRLLREIFSHPIRSIEHVDESGALSPHRPFSGVIDGPAVLCVVPGGVVPIDRGARRRIFELTLHLNRAGIRTHLLIGALGSRRRSRSESTLTAIAPAVHTYRKLTPPLPWRLRMRREAERAYRLVHGSFRRGPDLFVDRLATRAAGDGVRRLRDLLATGRYAHVIVNYAWMTGMVDAVREAFPSVKWICDTHDVQFVRNRALSPHASRLWIAPDEERLAELRALRTYDRVLAISESDRAELTAHLPDKSVMSTPAGVDYAYLPMPGTPKSAPFAYAFIGWKMSANVSALDLLVREWWPEILRISPGSRLNVAGRICKRTAAKKLVRDQIGVRMHGFVPSLASFYESVDVVLNPVMVQGGLNFKSVEALAAGRLLITNSVGARCLGAGAPVVVADSGESLALQLETLIADPAAMHVRRREGQEWALDRFGEESAYRGLRELLRQQ